MGISPVEALLPGTPLSGNSDRPRSALSSPKLGERHGVLHSHNLGVAMLIGTSSDSTCGYGNIGR